MEVILKNKMTEQENTKPKYEADIKFKTETDKAIDAGLDNPEAFEEKYINTFAESVGGVGDMEALSSSLKHGMMYPMRAFLKDVKDRFTNKTEFIRFLLESGKENEEFKKTYEVAQANLLPILRDTERLAYIGEKELGYKPEPEETNIPFTEYALKSIRDEAAKRRKPEVSATDLGTAGLEAVVDEELEAA
ncbi:hypothetical protein CL617_01385 [archaeon]|nr:hypothetical protein [archaeon]|tara:strand:+ start:1157 stop:1729 length:573 start_codon:yes stop_codon:yes gene_type:complete